MSEKGLLEDYMPVERYGYRTKSGALKYIGCKVCADLLNGTDDDAPEPLNTSKEDD